MHFQQGFQQVLKTWGPNPTVERVKQQLRQQLGPVNVAQRRSRGGAKASRI